MVYKPRRVDWIGAEERDEFDNWCADEFCVICGTKTLRDVMRVRFDPETGAKINHCVMRCPSKRWWSMQWHSGDPIHCPY